MGFAARNGRARRRGKEGAMKSIAQAAVAVMALFGLAACGGGGNGNGGAIHWRHDVEGAYGAALAWDGRKFAWGDSPFPRTPDHVERTDFAEVLHFTGPALGAVAGNILPTRGKVDIFLRGLTMTFHFGFVTPLPVVCPDEYPSCESISDLDHVSAPIRHVDDWAWDDSAGSGEFLEMHREGLDAVTGIEIYSNASGQQVHAAYFAEQSP